MALAALRRLIVAKPLMLMVSPSLERAPYAEGIEPSLSLLPLISDRHVDALTLAGNSQEVARHVKRLFEAGIGAIIVRPIAGKGVSAEDTIAAFGAIRPTIAQHLASRLAAIHLPRHAEPVISGSASQWERGRLRHAA